MKMHIQIDTDNAAFEDDPRHEVHRLLVDAVRKYADGYDKAVFIDSNGNKVGGWRCEA